MTEGARAILEKAARQTVHVFAGDPRWQAVTELQIAGLVRLRWGAGQIAQVVLTDKGRDALREGQDAA